MQKELLGRGRVQKQINIIIPIKIHPYYNPHRHYYNNQLSQNEHSRKHLSLRRKRPQSLALTLIIKAVCKYQKSAPIDECSSTGSGKLKCTGAGCRCNVRRNQRAWRRKRKMSLSVTVAMAVLIAIPAWRNHHDNNDPYDYRIDKLIYLYLWSIYMQTLLFPCHNQNASLPASVSHVMSLLSVHHFNPDRGVQLLLFCHCFAIVFFVVIRSSCTKYQCFLHTTFKLRSKR